MGHGFKEDGLQPIRDDNGTVDPESCILRREFRYDRAERMADLRYEERSTHCGYSYQEASMSAFSRS